MLDFMKENADKALHKTPLHICLAENGVEAEIVMEWTNSRSENWHVFTNGLENSEGGTSLTGIKTALTNFFKKKLKGEGSPDVLRKGLFYAVSCKVPNPSFANQTKTKINNPELRTLPECFNRPNIILENCEKLEFIHPSIEAKKVKGMAPKDIYHCQMMYLFKKMNENDPSFDFWFNQVKKNLGRARE
jgi:DNA gyrase/topoisomerase IV subunit B